MNYMYFIVQVFWIHAMELCILMSSYKAKIIQCDFMIIYHSLGKCTINTDQFLFSVEIKVSIINLVPLPITNKINVNVCTYCPCVCIQCTI